MDVYTVKEQKPRKKTPPHAKTQKHRDRTKYNRKSLANPAKNPDLTPVAK